MNDSAHAGRSRRVAVTELARFAGREGDLGRRHFSLLRGSEGIRAHQRVQRERGTDYQAEVSIRMRWESDGWELELFGRIDGVASTPEGPVIEEIKTTRDPEGPSLDASVHRLQARVYAWMWWRRYGVCPAVRLAYVSPEAGGKERREEWTEDPGALDREMEEVLGGYLDFLRTREAWIAERNGSLAELGFPFDALRPGQEELMREAERTVSSGGRLYVQAPTGIGKTMGILLPALREMGRGAFETLMVATCRNAGKLVFEEAFRLLTARGARVRVLTLVAKDRICRKTGSPCDCELCPLALGFYDRLPAALEEVRRHTLWDGPTMRAVSERHGVCPFAFQMCAAREADVLLGDVNYALDPSARLEFLFGGAPERVCVLLDEAHHLPDRARAMLSAELDGRKLRDLRKGLSPELRGGLSPVLERVSRALRAYQREALDGNGMPVEGQEPPEALGRTCLRSMEEVEASLAAAPGDPEGRIDLLRMWSDFGLSVERRRESHVCFREGQTLVHFCRDVADWLRERFDEVYAVVLFSATLQPVEAFRRLTGANPEDRTLVLSSPFPPERFSVEVEAGIPLVWRARTPAMYDRLAERIVERLTSYPGKTLVYFPSYAMLEEVAKRVPEHDLWMGPVYVQPRGLQEEAAEAFLRPFREASGSVTGLAVLGGALNEGIDLPGEALTSVIVVSIGLPAVGAERELLRAWFRERGEDGFVLAYTVPGLVRVAQAMGRVIRGPEDEGRALLIDPRFDHAFYREFLPSHPSCNADGEG